MQEPDKLEIVQKGANTGLVIAEKRYKSIFKIIGYVLIIGLIIAVIVWIIRYFSGNKLKDTFKNFGLGGVDLVKQNPITAVNEFINPKKVISDSRIPSTFKMIGGGSIVKGGKMVVSNPKNITKVVKTTDPIKVLYGGKKKKNPFKF
jgi:hypothetical protein